jgi:hypothetical protein
MSLSLVLVGTHLRRTGASDQMITCGQSTDTSAKYYHSPAHRKAWEKVEIPQENGAGEHSVLQLQKPPLVPYPTSGHLLIYEQLMQGARVRAGGRVRSSF